MNLLWILTGLCLAALSGLRAFLPLCVLVVAIHVGILVPMPDAAFLREPIWSWILGVLTGLELILSQVPKLNQHIRVVFFPFSLAAAALSANALLPPNPHAISWFAGLVLAGGLCALMRLAAGAWMQDQPSGHRFRPQHIYFREQWRTGICMIGALGALWIPWLVGLAVLAAAVFGGRVVLRSLSSQTTET